MEWLSLNWVWVLFIVAFVAMHMFGHGGHGSHGRRGRHGGGTDAGRDDSKPASKDGAQRAADQGPGHQH